MSSDDNSIQNLDQLNETLLVEILTYLPLGEIGDSTRQAS